MQRTESTSLINIFKDYRIGKGKEQYYAFLEYQNYVLGSKRLIAEYDERFINIDMMKLSSAETEMAKSAEKKNESNNGCQKKKKQRKKDIGIWQRFLRKCMVISGFD